MITTTITICEIRNCFSPHLMLYALAKMRLATERLVLARRLSGVMDDESTSTNHCSPRPPTTDNIAASTTMDGLDLTKPDDIITSCTHEVSRDIMHDRFIVSARAEVVAVDPGSCGKEVNISSFSDPDSVDKLQISMEVQALLTEHWSSLLQRMGMQIVCSPPTAAAAAGVDTKLCENSALVDSLQLQQGQLHLNPYAVCMRMVDRMYAHGSVGGMTAEEGEIIRNYFISHSRIQLNKEHGS